MAGPTVTLEFKGNETDAVSAMGRLEDASQSMSEEVGGASRRMGEAGGATDELADKAGGAEQKFIGFKDTITGTGDVIKGFRDGDVLTTAQGFADIAGGLESFLIPSLGRLITWIGSTAIAQGALSAVQTVGTAVTGALTTAMSALNAVIRANPIMFIVGLISVLVIAFLALWTRSEGFRNFFIGMWNDIKSVVGNVVDWIKNAWNGVVDFFAHFPQRIGQALGAIGGVVQSAFKGAVNIAIDAVNWMVDRINDLIYGINLINPFEDIPSIPHIPRMHSGGVVQGPAGSEHLRILRAGEVVSPTGASNVGGNSGAFALVPSSSADSAVGTLIDMLIRNGDITLVRVS